MSIITPGNSYMLDRFVEAQRSHYDSVLRELRDGQKASHWIWFIFPQLRGLGSSPLSQRFAIESLQEAQAYLEHPLLGPRLDECVKLVIAIRGRSAQEIFGSPDDLKLRSSMSLFAHATDQYPIFEDALNKYFDGHFDPLTLKLLGLK